MQARLERESSWATPYLTIARLPNNGYRPFQFPTEGEIWQQEKSAGVWDRGLAP
jgi:hypothetical protein